MKLSFASRYKSILQLPETALPPFTVLVGLNGSGKSQLLQAISAENVRCVSESGTLFSKGQIRLFSWADFLPRSEKSIPAQNVDKARENVWNQLLKVQQQFGSQLVEEKKKIPWSDVIPSSLELLPLYRLPNIESLLGDHEKALKVYTDLQAAVERLGTQARVPLEQRFPGLRDVINDIMEKHSVPFLAISRQMFMDQCPFGWTPADPFTTELTTAFAEYRAAEWQNTRHELLSGLGNPVTYLDRKTFLEKHGQPPWELINQILESTKLEFRIVAPPVADTAQIQLQIMHSSSRSIITIADLSSGEQILLALARCLFFMSEGERILAQPKVVLLDEVDAPLHPAMTQQLIRTIKEVIVERHGVNVILTTHSPATVALAPEECLFQMRAEASRLQKISKEAALADLTADLPTLSVTYENRRQVFVESEYDAKLYEPIFRKLRDHLNKEISLHFIASGNGGSGCCTQVRELVNALRGAGNKSVFGIIDWDMRNNGNDHVQVLGLSKRYALENYLLDPLLIAAYLFREKHENAASVGLDSDLSYLNLHSRADLHQPISDWVLGRVKEKVSEPLNGELVECGYLCSSNVQLPKWFLHLHGHSLEQAIKDAFQPLKRFQKEGELKGEIVKKVIDDTPQLLSMDFVELFLSIQESN